MTQKTMANTIPNINNLTGTHKDTLVHLGHIFFLFPQLCLEEFFAFSTPFFKLSKDMMRLAQYIFKIWEIIIQSLINYSFTSVF